MVTKPLIIKIEPNSALAKALDDADESLVILERDGVRYEVVRACSDAEDDPWANYDADEFRTALRQFAGSISPEMADQWREDVYRARQEGTRSLDRP